MAGPVSGGRSVPVPGPGTCGQGTPDAVGCDTGMGRLRQENMKTGISDNRSDNLWCFFQPVRLWMSVALSPLSWCLSTLVCRTGRGRKSVEITETVEVCVSLMVPVRHQMLYRRRRPFWRSWAGLIRASRCQGRGWQGERQPAKRIQRLRQHGRGAGSWGLWQEGCCCPGRRWQNPQRLHDASFPVVEWRMGWHGRSGVRIFRPWQCAPGRG